MEITVDIDDVLYQRAVELTGVTDLDYLFDQGLRELIRLATLTHSPPSV